MVQTTRESSALQPEVVQALQASGTWTWAYVDASGNREDPRRLAALQRRTVSDALREQGSSDRAVQVVEDELAEQPGVPAPVARYVLVRDDELVLSEVLPGHLHGQESVGTGAVPDLLPLLAHRPFDLPFLVVTVGREGGGFRGYRLGHAPSGAAEDEQRIQGRTDTLHKAKSGAGWKQPHWHQHTEEIWKQTAGEVAAAIEETVRATSPRLVLVAGDIRARELLRGELSTATRALVTEVPVDPRADDASEKALVQHVDLALARILASRRQTCRTCSARTRGAATTRASAGSAPWCRRCSRPRLRW